MCVCVCVCVCVKCICNVSRVFPGGDGSSARTRTDSYSIRSKKKKKGGGEEEQMRTKYEMRNEEVFGERGD